MVHTTTVDDVPSSIRTACRLFVASVTLGVVNGVLTLTQVDAIVNTTLDDPSAQPNVDPMMLEQAVRTSLITGIVIDLVIAALWIWLTYRVRAGKSWARMVMTGITVIGGVMALVNLGNEFPVNGFAIVIAVVQVLIYVFAVAAVVFMFRPDARDHFGR